MHSTRYLHDKFSIIFSTIYFFILIYRQETLSARPYIYILYFFKKYSNLNNNLLKAIFFRFFYISNHLTIAQLGHCLPVNYEMTSWCRKKHVRQWHCGQLKTLKMGGGQKNTQITQHKNVKKRTPLSQNSLKKKTNTKRVNNGKK